MWFVRDQVRGSSKLLLIPKEVHQHILSFVIFRPMALGMPSPLHKFSSLVEERHLLITSLLNYFDEILPTLYSPFHYLDHNSAYVYLLSKYRFLSKMVLEANRNLSFTMVLPLQVKTSPSQQYLCCLYRPSHVHISISLPHQPFVHDLVGLRIRANMNYVDTVYAPRNCFFYSKFGFCSPTM